MEARSHRELSQEVEKQLPPQLVADFNSKVHSDWAAERQLDSRVSKHPWDKATNQTTLRSQICTSCVTLGNLTSSDLLFSTVKCGKNVPNRAADRFK